MLDVDIVIPCFECGGGITGLDSLLSDIGSRTARCRAILVDDGSTAPHKIPDSVTSEAISVLRHATNRGRAAACNTGALAGSAELIWFLDSDCIPETASTLRAHLEVIAGHDASVGPIRAKGIGFWPRYQNRVADHRLATLRRGMNINACTSANLVIRRATFVASGGFDERYDKYGFEDRDLFLRLVENGCRIGFSEQAVAIHDANLDLALVCRKMITAGRYSSGVFRAAHASAYRCTKYGKLDVRDHGRMYGVTVSIVWTALRSVQKFADSFLKVRAVPFLMRAATASGFSAIAFAYGTLQAREDAGAP